MGKLNVVPQRTESIDFLSSATVDDGAGGTTAGDETVIWSTLASWKPLKASRLLEANQESLRQGYVFEFWVNPDFEPKVGQTIKFRDERLTNQGFVYTDETRRRYRLTAMEQINGAVSDSGQGT